MKCLVCVCAAARFQITFGTSLVSLSIVSLFSRGIRVSANFKSTHALREFRQSCAAHPDPQLCMAPSSGVTGLWLHFDGESAPSSLLRPSAPPSLTLECPLTEERRERSRKKTVAGPPRAGINSVHNGTAVEFSRQTDFPGKTAVDLEAFQFGPLLTYHRVATRKCQVRRHSGVQR